MSMGGATRRIHCFCGFPAQRLISHTHANPGRAFYKCAQQCEEIKCLFWIWEDERSVLDPIGRSISGIIRMLVAPTIPAEESRNNQILQRRPVDASHALDAAVIVPPGLVPSSESGSRCMCKDEV